MAMDSEVAAPYQGPGNLASGWNQIRYVTRNANARIMVTRKASGNDTRERGTILIKCYMSEMAKT